ncbi:MAG: MATE family efflux transporter, partial [Clostridium sp.]
AQIIQVFSNDASILQVGSYILIVMLISTMFNGITTLFMTVYQSSGEGVATGIMAISQGCLYIPIVIILNHFFGLHGLIWSMTITEITTCFIGAILYIPYHKKLKTVFLK